MEVIASTASSFRVDTAMDGSGKSGATPGTSAAEEVSVFFIVPPTLTQTPRPASTASRDDMDNLQTPTTTKERTGKSAIPPTPDSSSKAIHSSESSSIHDPTGEYIQHIKGDTLRVLVLIAYDSHEQNLSSAKYC